MNRLNFQSNYEIMVGITMNLAYCLTLYVRIAEFK